MIFSSVFDKKPRTLYHASTVSGLKHIEPISTPAYPDLGAVVFASSVQGFAACFGARWSDEYASIAVTHGQDNDKPNEDDIQSISFVVKDKTNVHMNLPCSMYIIAGHFKYMEYDGGLELISTESCKVMGEKKFHSFKEMLEYYNVKIVIE